MEGSAYAARELRHSSGDDDGPSSPPLPPPPQPQAPPPAGCRRNWFRDPLRLGCLLFLSASVAVSAYRSRHDPPALAFVLFAYVDLVSLFLCLGCFERLEPDGAPAEKARLKAAVWVLAAALMLGFTWKVAAVVPWPLAASIWILAGCVVAGGFYGLFVHNEHHDEKD